MALDYDLYRVSEILDFILISNQHVYDTKLKELSDSFTNTKEEYDEQKKIIEKEYKHNIDSVNFRRQMLEKRPLLDQLGRISEEEFNSLYKEE